MKFLNALILAVVVVGLMYAAVQIMESEIVYEKTENLEVETPVEELPKWQTDEDAIKAAQDVIRKKELQAELSQLDTEIKEKQAKRAEVAKELNSY